MAGRAARRLRGPGPQPLSRQRARGASPRLIDAAEPATPTAAAKAAHALKSMSLNIGAQAVAELRRARSRAEARDGAARHRRAALAEACTASCSPRLRGPGRRREPAAPRAPTPTVTGDHRRAGPARGSRRGRRARRARLVYQPQIDRDGAQVVGVESPGALDPPEARRGQPGRSSSRWPSACGLIRPMTGWVHRPGDGRDDGPDGLPVAFNASAAGVRRPGLRRRGRDAARPPRASIPRRLEIEITETAILNDGDQVRAQHRRALHDLGVQDRAGRLRRRLLQPEPPARYPLRQAEDRPGVRHRLRRRRAVGDRWCTPSSASAGRWA